MLVDNPLQSFLISMPVLWNKMTLTGKLVMLYTGCCCLAPLLCKQAPVMSGRKMACFGFFSTE